MGIKQLKAPNFEAIQKPLKYNPKYLLDRKGNPNGKKYLIENKEDGLRGFVIVRRKSIEAYTSGGVKVPNAKYIIRDLAQTLKSKAFADLAYGFVLDGEFLCKNWNGSNSAVKTQTYFKPLAKQLSFKTWTIIPIDDWDNRQCKLDEKDRKHLLDLVVKAIDSKRITQSKYKVWNNLSDLVVQQEMKIAVKVHSAEGIVIKEYNGLYLFKKNRVWMKLKPYMEADMTIIDAEEEVSIKGDLKNSLGAVIVKGIIDGKKIKTRVGGGYKRKDRIDLWKLHKQGKLVGKVIEMKHEGVTVNNAVRFPRFYRMRTDKKNAGTNE